MMGGRGKGVWTIFDGDGPGGIAEPAGSVSAGYSDPSRARPWSLHAVDAGGHPLDWASDSRGRARTFSTKDALLEFVHSNAQGPMEFQYPQGAYPEGSREAADNAALAVASSIDSGSGSLGSSISDFVVVPAARVDPGLGGVRESSEERMNFWISTVQGVLAGLQDAPVIDVLERSASVVNPERRMVLEDLQAAGRVRSETFDDGGKTFIRWTLVDGERS